MRAINLLAITAYLGLLFPLAPLEGGGPPLRVDGLADDWEGRPGSFRQDPADDMASTPNDLASLSVSNDATTLYFLVRYEAPYPSTEPDISLYMDTDNDEGTGFHYLGAAMDATWNLSDEDGSWYFAGDRSLGRGGFLLRSAYDPDTGILEMAFPLGMVAASRGGDAIAIGVIDNDSRDRLPNLGTEACLHPLDGPVRPFPPAGTIERRHTEDLRILSWNVLRDGPFKTGLDANFGRVLAALQPDIICFQEIYEASTIEVLRYVEEWIPLADEERFWRGRKNFDCITVSRYPIESTRFIDDNLVTEIDTTAVLGHKAWILNAHTPCCGDEEGRLEETDNFMRLLRRRMEEARVSGEDPFAIFLVGDMNTGGSRREMLTMAEGAIFNTFTDGPAFDPDWDGSGLADLAPLWTHERRIDTWRSLNNSNNTSRLDYIFYSDSLVFPARSFILNTRKVPEDLLDAYNLAFADTDAADHLPLVGDFRSKQPGAPWGLAVIDPSGWMPDSWLGALNLLDFPIVYSHRLGWLYQGAPTSETGAWFYRYGTGWIWMDRSFHPWYYDAQIQGWISLSPG